MPGTGGRGSRQDLLFREARLSFGVRCLRSTSELGDLFPGKLMLESEGEMIVGGVVGGGFLRSGNLETEGSLESESLMIGLKE